MMSDSDPSDDPLAEHQQRLQQEQNEICQSLRQACHVLAELGVAEVRIDYDGYGDSGLVEGLIASGPPGDIELPSELREQLLTAAEELLPCGWENNLGAFGELVLDVARYQFTRQHHWRTESSEYDEEVWKL